VRGPLAKQVTQPHDLQTIFYNSLLTPVASPLAQRSRQLRLPLRADEYKDGQYIRWSNRHGRHGEPRYEILQWILYVASHTSSLLVPHAACVQLVHGWANMIPLSRSLALARTLSLSLSLSLTHTHTHARGVALARSLSLPCIITKAFSPTPPQCSSSIPMRRTGSPP
jgi:hypothetical protein